MSQQSCHCCRWTNPISPVSIITQCLQAFTAQVTNLTVAQSFLPPILSQDPTIIPPAGSIYYNSTTMTLNYSNGTTIITLPTAPVVDLINRTNLTITPTATLELIDNSIPDDLPDVDTTINLVIPPSPLGQVKTFILLSIGTPDTSADVRITGGGISATLTPTGPSAIQSATFVFAGLDNGWINISASSAIPPVPSFFEPASDSSSKLKLDVEGAPGSQFGSCIVLSQDGVYVAVGAPTFGNGTNTGQVVILKQNPNNDYVNSATINPTDSIGDTLFGSSLAFNIDASLLVIGGPGDDANAGAAWVYSRSGDTWTKEIKLIPPVDPLRDRTAKRGFSVAIGHDSANGDIIFVGYPFADVGDIKKQGQVAFVKRSLTGVYSNFAYFTNNVTVPYTGSLFGYSLNCNNNNLVAVGGPGHGQFVDEIPSPGAVWIGSWDISSSEPTAQLISFIPAPPPLTSESLSVVELVKNKKISKFTAAESLAPTVVNDTTANFGNIVFDTANFIHTTYQLPTAGDFGPGYIYTSQSDLPFPQTLGTQTPLYLGISSISGYWPIPAQPRNTISACPRIASDVTNNILYIAYANGSSPDPDAGSLSMTIIVLKSTDGGATWLPVTSPRPMNTNSSYLSNIKVDPMTGNVAVVWYDCSNSVTNDSYEVFVTVSSDQGNTWGAVTNLSANIGASANARHNDGNESGDYIGIDFYNGQLVVAWADNSPNITPPNPNPPENLEMVIGVGIMTVSGNVITVVKVVNASGTDMGPHFSPAIAINKINPLEIAVASSTDNQLYYAVTGDGGNTWTGSNIFTGASPPGLKQAYGYSSLIAGIDGSLYFGYLAFDFQSPIIAKNSSFSSNADDFVLLKDFTANPPRDFDMPVLGYTVFSGVEYLAMAWQDQSQGYTFVSGNLPIPPGGLHRIADAISNNKWSNYYVCLPPIMNPLASSNSIRLQVQDNINYKSFGSFGSSVSLNTNTLAVGAPQSLGGTNTVGASPFSSVFKFIGATFIYTGAGSNWNQLQLLIGSNYLNNSNQGSSVALSADGRSVIIGGPNDGTSAGAGAVWVFTLSNLNYIEQGVYRNLNLVGNAKQGYSVTISGNGSIRGIGAPFNNDTAGKVFFQS